MFVSPRFRDIFGSRPIKIRRADRAVSAKLPESHAEGEPVVGCPDAESIWLDITAAHRRAARVFTPERIRVEDLARDER